MSDHGSGTTDRNGHQPTVGIDAPQLDVAARHPERVEIVVAVLFVLSLLGFAAFGAAFVQNANNEWLGGTLGLGLAAFGAAFVAWGRYLMPRGPFEEPRALMEVSEGERELLVNDFATRGKVAIRRRTFLVKLLGAAGGVFTIVLMFPLLRSLGPLPGKSLYTTKWRKGSYLTTIDGQRIHTADISVGGIVTVFPADDIGGAQSQTVLLHLQDGGDIVTKPGRETWGPDGYLAFSKVCTHAGCPVGLFEQLTQQLLCPCHQSLFDVRAGAQPIFGPAPRPLAQLPLYVDADGYLRAQDGFDEPIGPGFWERGGTT